MSWVEHDFIRVSCSRLIYITDPAMLALLFPRACRAYLMLLLLSLRACRACRSRDILARSPSTSSNMRVTIGPSSTHTALVLRLVTCLKCWFISINDVNIFLKSRNIIECEFMLLEMLNDFFNKLFFVEYFKNASNRNLKIIESRENFIVDIFFVVKIWLYFRLKSMLNSFFKINECEKHFLILRNRIENKVQFHLYELIV